MSERWGLGSEEGSTHVTPFLRLNSFSRLTLNRPRRQAIQILVNSSLYLHIIAFVILSRLLLLLQS